MTEDELYRAIHSDIKGLKVAVQRVADQVSLCNNRMQAVENRMDRTESGAKRMNEERTAVEEKLDAQAAQNAQILLNQAIADTRRDTLERLIKFLVVSGVPFSIAVLGGIIWLIQHVGVK